MLQGTVQRRGHQNTKLQLSTVSSRSLLNTTLYLDFRFPHSGYREGRYNLYCGSTCTMQQSFNHSLFGLLPSLLPFTRSCVSLPRECSWNPLTLLQHHSFYQGHPCCHTRTLVGLTSSCWNVKFVVNLFSLDLPVPSSSSNNDYQRSIIRNGSVMKTDYQHLVSVSDYHNTLYNKNRISSPVSKEYRLS